MHSSTLTPPPPTLTFPSFFLTKSPTRTNPISIHHSHYKPNKQNNRKLSHQSHTCTYISRHGLKHSPSLKSNNTRNLNLPISCSVTTSGLAASKLQLLVSEFRSLPEAIDRVKRLLNYADQLPPLNELARVEANKVTGCTAQVWLEVSMDELGRMRFGADSDSEITKGFCSCLIWVMDGAEPEEVVEVKAEDLVEMNVGLVGKAYSRVNTWDNVLMSMQTRTRDLVAEREGKALVEPLQALVQARSGKVLVS